MATKKLRYALFLIVAWVFVAGACTEPSGPNCSEVAFQMADCFSYVINDSPESAPSASCCSEVATVVEVNANCLCDALTLAEVMGPVNATRGLGLPKACNMVFVPIISCSSAPLPSPAPGSSPLYSPPPKSTPPPVQPPTYTPASSPRLMSSPTPVPPPKSTAAPAPLPKSTPAPSPPPTSAPAPPPKSSPSPDTPAASPEVSPASAPTSSGAQEISISIISLAIALTLASCSYLLF